MYRYKDNEHVIVPLVVSFPCFNKWRRQNASGNLENGDSMLYTNATKTAMRICYDAHAGQVDKAGLPYVFHPFHLAEQMDTEHEVCAALLHDVMEDTDTTADDLVAAGIPREYVATCLKLRHDPGVPYTDYVAALKDDPVARRVKIADLTHNSDLTRLDHEPTEADLQRLEKYQAALRLLDSES